MQRHLVLFPCSCKNNHYATREAYLAALADAMRDEYETIVASGIRLYNWTVLT